MMQEVVNSKGGVLGRPLEIVIEDDKSDPKEAVTAANRLIEQKKAVALIASTISPSTLAVKEITATKGLPQIAMAAANDITDKAPMEWIWRTPHKDALAVSRALDYVANVLKVKKIAVLHDENAFGSSGNAEIAKQAPTLGLEVVASESYKTADTDLTAQLTKIRGASPEVLIVWGTNPGPALAAKNMQQLGMDIPYVGSHGIANKTFIELAGEAAEGVVFPAGRLLVPSSITDPAQKAVTDEFIAQYQAKYGSSPNTFAGYAFEAVVLLVNAIERAGSTDPAAIQTALDSTKDFALPDGYYTYSKTDHDGLKASDMIMVKIQDGTWVLAQ
jgi:branched-chain amino acid transport system substrate-binding protein